jgi:hypothetical protein
LSVNQLKKNYTAYQTEVETIFLFRLPIARSHLSVNDGLVAVDKWLVNGKRLICSPLKTTPNGFGKWLKLSQIGLEVVEPRDGGRGGPVYDRALPQVCKQKKLASKKKTNLVPLAKGVQAVIIK